ncbi:hypothetical protein NQ176_g10906 [Zarea fungicola]|uniref:Uncharacterized protein n=1 Tax=Zarea fungicola TaxID=93591 RepID=A0ACC1MD12_9HYPO|nr:hypothetical protein NQ176_g10906 [Lecanicillium fungicola]
MVKEPSSSSGVIQGSYKEANCGSYAIVKPWNAARLHNLAGIRFSCYIQPWLPDAKHEQVLISTLDVNYGSGFAATIDHTGTISIYVGNGTTISKFDTAITLQRWKWVELELCIVGETLVADVRPQGRLAEIAPRPSHYVKRLDFAAKLDGLKPLTLAAGYFSDASTSSPQATNIFNGRLDSPHISTSLDGLTYNTWAKFDFSLDMSSDTIVDTSGNAHHGALVNAPTRAVKGFNWDGSEPDWTKAKYGYGAIHFHDDDLDDAAWSTDFTIQLPTSALSGAYAVIVQGVDEAANISDHITFFVRPPPADEPHV